MVKYLVTQMRLEIGLDLQMVKLREKYLVKWKHSEIDSVRLTVIPMD